VDDFGGVAVWLFFLLRLAVLFGVIAASIALVRRANARAGITLAAAAGLQVLWSCCNRVVGVAMMQELVDPRTASTAATCVDLPARIVTTGLVVAAFVALSRAVTNREPPPVG